MRGGLTLWLLCLAATAEASPQLERAKVEDASLRKSDGKLKLRHNLTKNIELWREAEAKAQTDAERREAARGHAEAWALLAHWSGLAADAKQAEVMAARAAKHESQRLLGVAARVVEGTIELALETPRGSTSSPQIERGTYGERRLFFDLSPVVAVKEALGDLSIDAPEVERARVGQLDGDTVRVVIDFAAARPAEIEIQGRRIRIRLKRRESASLLSEIVAEVKEAYPDVLVESVAHAAEPMDESTPKSKAKAPKAPKAKSGSVLAIRKVVIDAGHGGKDHGASGKAGKVRTREKEVNLGIAIKLGKELEKRGVKVVYTRTEDRFVSLERRASIANGSGADLFISIHANAHRSAKIHGIETYYLNTSSNRYASRLARRENGTGGLPELDPEEESTESVELPDGALGADLRLILADLAMRSATSESKRIAGYVQTSMIGSLKQEFGAKDLGVKSALFAVLLGVRMPSVLIETGFVSHPAEAERLSANTYQAKVAKAIARGVERYVGERERLAVNVR